MAGFLCAEPLFNKEGVVGALANAKAHHASLTVAFGREGTDPAERVSALVPLEISEARRLWLESRGAAMQREGDRYRGTSMTGAGAEAVTLRWALVPVAGAARWRVFYEPASLAGGTAAVNARLAAASAGAKDARGRADAEADAVKFRRYSEFIAGPQAPDRGAEAVAGLPAAAGAE